MHATTPQPKPQAGSGWEASRASLTCGLCSVLDEMELCRVGEWPQPLACIEVTRFLMDASAFAVCMWA